MSEGQRSTLLAYLRRLVGGAAPDCCDAELLERFATQRDETAFESLLCRHGPLVWSVCRRVLDEEHTAEDAFQATFLVLVRKARSVRKQASIRSWLHGVALRVALRARQQEQLRQRRERETPSRCPGEATWQEVRPILDEEIQRLPEKYRLPVILCYLEGHTNDEAARLLNCPRGTIATRLARARERLRFRLLRRGVTLSVGTLAAMLTDNALSASVPPLLLTHTAKAALMGAASVSVTTLTEGVLHTMFLSKLKMASVFFLSLVAIGGAGVGAYHLHAQAPAPKSENSAKKPAESAPDKPAAKAPEKEADTLTTLMQERLKLAQQEVEVCQKLYQSARANFDELVTASKDLLKAELELSTKRADRLAAHERYVKMMEAWVEFARARKESGRGSGLELVKAQYLLVDAKIDLEREKTRK
ncbi:MAG TPA: sigma-70 family RNA polymerase sigma factor [Gemmataceae bacterium]|jgi:RNA polymerase sigma factor (sigma-70 family)